MARIITIGGGGWCPLPPPKFILYQNSPIGKELRYLKTIGCSLAVANMQKLYMYMSEELYR